MLLSNKDSTLVTVVGWNMDFCYEVFFCYWLRVRICEHCYVGLVEGLERSV